MSEDNVPKLRLKPKLAIDPIPLEPAALTESVPSEAPPVEESRAFRLKPRLFPPPPEGGDISANRETPATSENPSPVNGAPAGFEPGAMPPPNAERSGATFSLKRRATADPIPMEMPPPGEGVPVAEPPLLPTGIPFPGDRLIGEVPPDAGAVTSRPFPPPPANFPPPPGSGKPAPPWARPAAADAAPGKGNLVRVAGGAVAVLLLLGAGFFGYRKFTAGPPAPPPVEAKAPAKPPAAESPAIAAVASAPAAESVPVSTPAAPEPQPEPVVEEAPPPPPPASVAFRAWVDNLRVSGVRTGSETRVFIGGTSYEAGETVNPQLGIVFETYNTETRRLVFRDKTGAVVERRN